MKDLYDVLGVDPSAEPDEIKKAYRKQALVWHPGTCGCSLEQGMLLPHITASWLWPMRYKLYWLLHNTINCSAHMPTQHLTADKNQHRLEAAAEVFKEISNAYEILSDPHERAWCAITALMHMHMITTA